MAKHDWVCKDIGEWWSDYQCQKCNRRITTQPDDDSDRDMYSLDDCPDPGDDNEEHY